ncbi:MAG: MBL fold metallo-hydrolase [Kiritimatiellia bacterium]
MSLTLQFLGTGTSVGVPQIGCRCATCTSTDARDRRRRSGLYVRAGRTAFVVDTPPEFREACLELNITKVDAVVVTHAHMDHVAGFDDVRRFNTLNGKSVLNCYAAPETIAALHQLFPYITTKANPIGLYRPMIAFKPVTRAFRIGEVKVTPLPVEHGGPRTNGYLFETGGRRAAYVSDCISIPKRTLEKVRGVDVMVLDCLRERAHPTHMNLERALAAMREIGPGRGFLTHMSHDVKHAEFSKLLPRGVHLAYDGLTVRI